MANPQLENGSIAIALDLLIAIARYDLTGLERRVLDAVIYVTYGSQPTRTKAEMTIEDIRYLLGADDKLRTDRLKAALDKLIGEGIIFRQELVNGKQLLGVQKDYDRWVPPDKMSEVNINIKSSLRSNTYKISSDKMSGAPTPVKLMEYAMSQTQFRYSTSTYRAELKQAKRLYLEVLGKVMNGELAYNLIVDYIDEHDWIRQHTRFIFTHMNSTFFQWYAQIPRKPREIRESEEALGRRYRYNVRNKNWEATGANQSKEVQ
jgi:phage replication O-like protein O